MGLEYELKYRATEAVLERIRQRIPGEELHYQMETTYYDTPSGALSARWYTLRRRLENGRSVCTLKAPAEGCGRGEWEVECDCVTDAVDKLCKLGGPAELPKLTEEGILEVCGARFRRVAKSVRTADCTVEIALDSGVLMGGGRELPLCEVEVELKSGTPEAAVAYAEALAAEFGLEPERKSKFRRALALYKGE